MDYTMFKKSAELLKKKDFKALGKHIHGSDTSPREYVMSVINKKDPASFKKIYGNQTGFLATMKPIGLKEEDDHEVSMAIGQVRVMKERLDTIMSFLSSKTDEYNIEGWVQSYITSAEETLTTIADYLDKNPDVQTESSNLDVDNVKQTDTAKEKELKIKLDKEKDADALEKQLIALQGQLNITKQKLENEKNKVVKPEPNPETGEVPLRTGIANAIMDKKGKINGLLKKTEKQREVKVGGQSKVEINPKADIGQYSGGNQVNTGNLHQGGSLVRDYKELYREVKGDLPRIYVDMDGVLCDFIAQSKKATGKIFTQDKAKEYWPIIKRTPRFWSDMPWMPGGKQLWNYIKQYNPHILSAYTPEDPNCIPGKKTWLRKNVRISSNRVNLVRRVEKQKFAMKSDMGRAPAILIDDFPRNIDQFKAAGGMGIVHTSTSNTLRELKKLGF